MARRERAIAHEMAKKLEFHLARMQPSPGRMDAAVWAGRVVEFTKPRPWWRFW